MRPEHLLPRLAPLESQQHNLVFGIGDGGLVSMLLENVVNLNETTNAVERILFSIVDLSCPA
jgi:hypothetical protein